MKFTDSHLDSQETYLKLRRALIRIMGRPDPNLANIARNMGVDAEELTQFIKRHLTTPSNITKGDLDKLNAKFNIGVPVGKPAPASAETATEAEPARRARRAAVIPPPSEPEEVGSPEDGFEIVRASTGGGRRNTFAAVNCAGSLKLGQRLLDWLKDNKLGKIEPDAPLMVLINRRSREIIIKSAPPTLDDVTVTLLAREHGKEGRQRRLNLRSVKEVWPKATYFTPNLIEGALVLLKPKTA